MEEPEKLLEKLSRPEKSHKGQNGKVAIVGGSEKYTGAPAISAKAALRTGSDLVEIVTSEKVKDIVAGYSENFIVNTYASGNLGLSGLETVLNTVQKSDVAVIGPGLDSPDAEAVKKIIERAETSLVIDADAIELAVKTDIGKAVLTPHAQEAEIIKDRYGSIESFVAEKGSIVVVKGCKDKIYAPKSVFENTTGCASMTVGGTGDMLTGIISSLVSQGFDLEEAARLGCLISGKCGERAAKEHGNGALATDMIEEIPGTMRT